MKNKIKISLKNLIIIIVIAILIVGVYLFKVYTVCKKNEIENQKLSIGETSNINDEKSTNDNFENNLENVAEENIINVAEENKMDEILQSQETITQNNENQKGIEQQETSHSAQLNVQGTENSKTQTTNSNKQTATTQTNTDQTGDSTSSKSTNTQASSNTNSQSSSLTNGNLSSSTSNTQQAEAKTVKTYTMYEFRTSWCGYCNQMQAIYDKYKNYASNIKFKQIYLDSDLTSEQQKIVDSYYAGEGVPDFEFVDSNENLVDSIIGASSESYFKSVLDGLKE